MLNVIAVMGRLVAEPELRKTSSGISTITLRIACDRSYAKPGTERQTDFFDVVAWRGTAEFAAKYFRKGQLIAVDGSLQMRNWEDREGKKRTSYEIVANNLHFADSKPSGGDYNAGAGAPARSIPEEAPSYSAGSTEDFAVIDESEDLPF